MLLNASFLCAVTYRTIQFLFPSNFKQVPRERKGERKSRFNSMLSDSEVDKLPFDLLVHIFTFILSFRDLALASGVSRKWRRGVEESFAAKEKLSFNGWKMDDESAARLIRASRNLKELDISRSCWGSQITDAGLYMISLADCANNLTSVSLWGMAGITDEGVIQLVSRTTSLQHLNIGGTFITDKSLYAIANHCRHLKSIVLWSCRHVTESGMFMLVNKCQKLEAINVWGMRVPPSCFTSLLMISPALQIKPIPLHQNMLHVV